MGLYRHTMEFDSAIMNGIVVFRKMDGTVDPTESKELGSQRQVSHIFYSM